MHLFNLHPLHPNKLCGGKPRLESEEMDPSHVTTLISDLRATLMGLHKFAGVCIIQNDFLHSVTNHINSNMGYLPAILIFLFCEFRLLEIKLHKKSA